MNFGSHLDVGTADRTEEIVDSKNYHMTQREI